MWPGSSSAAGSPGRGAASRLTTTGRPANAVRQTPTVDVPDPPGSSTQSGSGCHMPRTLADVSPRGWEAWTRADRYRRTAAPGRAPPARGTSRRHAGDLAAGERPCSRSDRPGRTRAVVLDVAGGRRAPRMRGPQGARRGACRDQVDAYDA